MPKIVVTPHMERIVLEILDVNIPYTIEEIRRKLNERLYPQYKGTRRGISWNTVQKILENLINKKQVETIKAGKLTLYKIRTL
jgi:predicted transcriptional regulator